MPILFRDFETRSTVDIKKVGAWRYAADPTTDVWCVGYAVDDGPVEIWIPGQDPIPEAFLEAARNPDWLIVAHNDAFERAIEELILGPRFAWPLVPIERHRCTMAMALASALPGALDGAAEALGSPFRKDIEGQRLMRLMAKPRKPRPGEDPNGIYWHDEPEKQLRLQSYCKRDVDAERDISKCVLWLSPDEQFLWQLDAEINRRGFYTDGPLLEAASRIAAAADQAVQEELARITDGALTSTDQVAALQAWLGQHGCEVKDIRKGTLRHALRRTSLDPTIRRVIELRLGAAHAAAAKIDSLLAWCSVDGRVRGTLKFHGAGTGRWAGHGPQPQNFKRDGDGIEGKCLAIATGDLVHVAELYTQPLEAVGDIARAMICAAPRHRLLIGDYSGVESRVTAWVSGQQSKLDQWAKFDRTGDPRDEPYYLIGRDCGLAEGIAREKGKVADLAFGYQGGVGAWEKLAPDDDPSTEEDIRRYQRAWRNAHPSTVAFWYGIDRVAIAAVRRPGTTFSCGRFSLACDGTFLRITLPSGRSLSYPFPRLEAGKYGDPMVVFKDASGGKWTDCRFGQGAYGGLWTENIVQATSRDLLAAAMMRLEAAGYPIVLHVHDEIVAEVPIGFGSLEEFQRIITAVPDWAEGLPIAAKVREGERFSKSEKPRADSTDADGIELDHADHDHDGLDPGGDGLLGGDPDDHRHGDEVADDDGGDLDHTDDDVAQLTGGLAGGQAAAAAPPPITHADNLNEINAGLKREGIAPINIIAAPAAGDEHAAGNGAEADVRPLWSTPTITEITYTPELRGLHAAEMAKANGSEQQAKANGGGATRPEPRTSSAAGGEYHQNSSRAVGKCRCPNYAVHNNGDRNPSLVVYDDNHGYCHVCKTYVHDVRELPPEEDTGYSSGGADGSKAKLFADVDASLRRQGFRPAHNFEIKLPDGTLLFTETRYEHLTRKTGPRNKPDKVLIPHQLVDGVERATAGKERMIYNAREIACAKRGSLVLIPEGGLKAKCLIEAGLLATYAPFNNWPEASIYPLRGMHLAYLADKDSAGNRNAEAARKALAPIAASFRAMPAEYLWKHLPSPSEPLEKDGVEDWLELGGDPAKLLEICREIPAEGIIAAEPYRVPEEEQIAPWDWLYGQHLLRGEVSGTIAMGGTGKSSSSIVEALAMASGRELLGEQIQGRQRVALINLEDTRNTMDKRITAAMRYYRLTPADIGDRLLVKAKGEIKIKVARQLRSGDVERNEQIIRALTTLMIDHQAEVLSIDSFIRTHKVNENDNSAIEEVIECFEQIATEAQCAVHLWHHTRKSGGEKATIESARGAIAFVDAVRSARVLETMSAKVHTELKAVQPGMMAPGYYFRSFNGKRNFAPPADQSDWFRLESVELRNGDNVGVVTPWQYPATWSDLSREVVDCILEEIDEGLSNGQRYSGAKSAKAPRAAWCVVQKHCREKPETQCREIIRVWIDESKELVSREYDDPVQRKKLTGLFRKGREEVAP